MHARAVPVERRIERSANRFAPPLDIDAVFLADSGHNVTGNPHLVSGALGAFAEDLEFPLPFRHLGIDALDVDSGVQTDVDVLFNELTRHVADVLVANASVVRTLRTGESAGRKAEGRAVLVKEILLLEAKPRFRIVRNRRARIRWMRR